MQRFFMAAHLEHPEVSAGLPAILVLTNLVADHGTCGGATYSAQRAAEHRITHHTTGDEGYAEVGAGY